MNVTTPPPLRHYTIHVVGRHTLSQPDHLFVHLPFGITLRQAAQVARVLSIFPAIYHTNIRVDEGFPEIIAQEFPGSYVKGEYRQWQRAATDYTRKVMS